MNGLKLIIRVLEDFTEVLHVALPEEGKDSCECFFMEYDGVRVLDLDSVDVNESIVCDDCIKLIRVTIEVCDFFYTFVCVGGSHTIDQALARAFSLASEEYYGGWSDKHRPKVYVSVTSDTFISSYTWME